VAVRAARGAKTADTDKVGPSTGRREQHGDSGLGLRETREDDAVRERVGVERPEAAQASGDVEKPEHSERILPRARDVG
jgi:hypothetical protein